MEKIFFITVNYNSSESVIAYIEEIEIKCKNYNYKIIIVDNNSSDEDLNKLKANINNQAILIEEKNNLGYFKGLNIGINYILEEKGKFDKVIIGNNDIRFDCDFFENLKKCKYDSKTAVLAPSIMTLDGIYQNPHVIDKISRLRKTFYNIYYLNYYLGTAILKFHRAFLKKNRNEKVNKEMDIYMGIGAFYILTENFFNKFNSIDDRVFLWGEEALLGNQIKSNGLKIRYVPSLNLVHLENVCTSKINSKRKYNQMRESYRIFKKYL